MAAGVAWNRCDNRFARERQPVQLVGRRCRPVCNRLGTNRGDWLSAQEIYVGQVGEHSAALMPCDFANES